MLVFGDSLKLFYFVDIVLLEIVMLLLGIELVFLMRVIQDEYWKKNEQKKEIEDMRREGMDGDR